MKDAGFQNRTELLRTITNRGFSQSAKHETMLLFGAIRTQSEKDEAAKRAIPLVKACKTEEEAVQAVKTVIAQMTE